MKDRFKEVRKTLKLKQREVADRLGVTVSAVGAWEIGGNISDARLFQFCKEFGISIEWMKTGNGSMFAERKAKEIHEFSDEEIMLESGIRIYNMMPDNVKKLFDKVVDSIRQNNGNPTKAYEYIRKSLDRIPR